MAIETRGKRFGKRLRKSKVFGHGHGSHKPTNADLLITPLVDMFVIIVLFLIANFSATGEILNMTKDIQLPTATHVDELELAPVIMVSNDDIIINGISVARVADLSRDDYVTIPALEEKLREQKKETEELHALANDGTAFKGVVNIQGHKDVPFRIIKRVMFSCQGGGYGNINFAVLRGSTGQGGEKTAALQ
jgi:biopolymer transport protein ExbD